MRCNFQRRKVFQTAKAATFAKAQTERDHRTPRSCVLEWKDMADAKFSGVRALIFDLDGTLIDSKRDLIHSVNAMLRELKRPQLAADTASAYTTAMRIPRTFTSIASPIWRNSSTTPDERRTTQHRNFAQAASCIPGARLADSTRATWTVSRAGDGRWGAARGAPRCGGDDGIRGRAGNGMPAPQLE